VDVNGGRVVATPLPEVDLAIGSLWRRRVKISPPRFLKSLECCWKVPASDPFAADAVCRSALLANLIPQIQYGVRQRSELREPDPPLHLPPPEPMPELFVTGKLINEFLIAL